MEVTGTIEIIILEQMVDGGIEVVGFLVLRQSKLRTLVLLLLLEQPINPCGLFGAMNSLKDIFNFSHLVKGKAAMKELLNFNLGWTKIFLGVISLTIFLPY